MKNSMKEQLRKEMAQSRAFKVIQIYATHCGEDVALFGKNLVATMYDAEDAVDYIEFLEQKHLTELTEGYFKIGIHIVKAEVALAYSRLTEFAEYRGEKYGIVANLLDPEDDEKITNKLVKKTDLYNFYHVYSHFGDRCLLCRVAEKRDPFEVEIENAPGKKFGDLADDLQTEILEDADEYDINKETGECFVSYHGKLTVKATLISAGNYTIDPNAIVEAEVK